METLTKGGLGFVIAAIILATGAMILNGFQSNIEDTNSTAYSIIELGLESISAFGGWLPTLALVIVAGVVIAYVMNIFRGSVQ